MERFLVGMEDVDAYLEHPQQFGMTKSKALITLSWNEGMKAKPQLDVRIEDASSLQDVQKEMDVLIKKAERFLEAGADMIMFDADGITKGVDEWRTDLVAKMIVDAEDILLHGEGRKEEDEEEEGKA
ncbi:hypothetical protein L7F22_016680 [Adiantum nelumboides]|nr:hypothetical protein [Adiantum nelumboides]